MHTPPQLPLKWDHTVKEITDYVNAAIERLQGALDHVGSLDSKDCNFQSVFVFLEEEKRAFDSVVEPLIFYQNVSGTQELRDSASTADSSASAFKVEMSMRIDVFNSKIAAEKNIKESGDWDKLSAEERRLVEKMILDGRRNGLSLPTEKREELTLLKKELSQVCLDYMVSYLVIIAKLLIDERDKKNFNEEKGIISFTKEELKGVPEDVMSGYGKRMEGETELYDVTFKSPDSGPILGYAELPETRRRMSESMGWRLSVNEPIIARAVELRRKTAKLLGYNNWADYITDDRMIKSGKAIDDFLEDLIKRLHPFGVENREALLDMKKKEHELANLVFDGKFYTWDNGYYDRKFTEETLKIDSRLIKEHFPVSVVVPAILNMYQDMFQVRFEQLEDVSVWHPDAQVYAVWEKERNNEAGFIGYCYLDLYPRPGKFSHIAVWPLNLGYDLPDGRRNFPVAALLASFTKPTPGTPALMRHHDVVMFFHEMGHVFHELLSNTKFSRFHGTSGTLDFVEAPSQMLENWCWEPKILTQISSHYQTGNPLSNEMAESLVKSRHVNAGLFYLGQLFYAKYDFKIHYDCDQLETPEDYTHLWCTMYNEMMPLDQSKECPGQCSFSHLASGYDVGYYGYLYSQVFAADMYGTSSLVTNKKATIFKDDPLNPGRARLYREKVLLPGASRDELDILKDFLGRLPNSEAFSKQVFGTVSESK